MKLFLGIILMSLYFFGMWQALIVRPAYMKNWNLKSRSLFVGMILCFFFGFGLIFSK
jgi:antibiotic biosynthesis monooxygenase (ABM) superfamily enzyme